MASGFPEVRASKHGSWNRWSCAKWKGQRTQGRPVVAATSGLEHIFNLLPQFPPLCTVESIRYASGVLLMVMV